MLIAQSYLVYGTVWFFAVLIGIPTWIYYKVRRVVVQCWFFVRHNKLKICVVLSAGFAAGFLWQYRKLKKEAEKSEARRVEIELQRNNYRCESRGEIGPMTDLIRRAVLAGCAYVSLLGCVNGAFNNTIIRDLVWLVGSMFRFLASPPAVCTEGTPCCALRTRRGRFCGGVADCNCACHDPPDLFGDLNTDHLSEDVRRRHTVPVVDSDDDVPLRRRTEPSYNGLNFSHGGNDERWNWRKWWWSKPAPVPTSSVEDALGGAALIAEMVDEPEVKEDISWARQMIIRLKRFFLRVIDFLLSQATSVNMLVATVAVTGFVFGAMVYFYTPYLRRRYSEIRQLLSSTVSVTVETLGDLEPSVPLRTDEIDAVVAEVKINPLNLEEFVKNQESMRITTDALAVAISQLSADIAQESRSKVRFDLDDQSEEEEEQPLETKKGKTKSKGKLVKVISKARNRRERGAGTADREYKHVNPDAALAALIPSESDKSFNSEPDEYDIYQWEAPDDADEPLIEDEEEREWLRTHTDKDAEDYLAAKYGDYVAYAATDARWKKESNSVNMPEVFQLPETISTDANIIDSEMFYVLETKGQVKLFLYDCPLCKSEKHPISRCPKNKRKNWRFISKKSGVKVGAAPAEGWKETELGYIYDNEKVSYARTTNSLERAGQQSKIEGVPIIDVENMSSLVIPIFDEKHEFMHCAIPIGNYLLGPAHGQGTEKLYAHQMNDEKDEWIPLEIVEVAPNVPAIWATDDIVWYKKPNNLRSTHIGPAPVNNGKVYIVGFHNGRLAFSGPRSLLSIEESTVAGARLQFLIHDCSTDNGFSGGAVVNAETGKICAMHLGTRQRNKENYSVVLHEEPVLEFLRRQIPKQKKATPPVVAPSPTLN